MPMPVATFIDSQDWTGRTIHPLATSEASGLKHSPRHIKEIAPAVTLTEGLAVFGHDANVCDDALKAWIKGLGY